MSTLFDIVGPIMIGPSSSHTAGACRIGALAKKILGEDVKEAKLYLHGSFTQTYKGHGTDKALIAGLLGFETFDPRLRNSFDINIVGILKSGEFYIPRGTDAINPNDVLVVVGKTPKIRKFDNFLNN